MEKPFVEKEMATKVCSHCGRELPVSEFNKRSASSDGLQNWCRDCMRKSHNESYSRRRALSSLSHDDAPNPLASFKPRALIEELRRRGYKGKLTYTHEIML